MNKLSRAQKKVLRTAVANYMRSEVCACCEDHEQHQKDREELGKLLGIRPIKDGDEIWHDFGKFESR